jgi:hypothetical protein
MCKVIMPNRRPAQNANDDTTTSQYFSTGNSQIQLNQSYKN